MPGGSGSGSGSGSSGNGSGTVGVGGSGSSGNSPKANLPNSAWSYDNHSYQASERYGVGFGNSNGQVDANVPSLTFNSKTLSSASVISETNA